MNLVDTMKYVISKITVNELTHDQLGISKNLKILLDFRYSYINPFATDLFGLVLRN